MSLDNQQNMSLTMVSASKSVANYVINTAVIGIFSTPTENNGVGSQFRTTIFPEKTKAQTKLCSDPISLSPRRERALAKGVWSAKVSIQELYLRPTVTQSPCNFFEITRDSGSSEPNVVSTRLPKKLQFNRVTVSASKVAQAQDTIATEFVANYAMNTAAAGEFS